MGRMKDFLMDVEDDAWFILSKNPNMTIDQLSQEVKKKYWPNVEWVVMDVWRAHNEKGNLYYESTTVGNNNNSSSL